MLETTHRHDRGGFTRLLAVLGVITTLVLAGSPPALGAVPENDTLESSAPIDVPVTLSADTSEATIDEIEQLFASDCGYETAEAGVWYSFSTQEPLLALAYAGEATDYAAGVVVIADYGEGEQWIESCGWDFVAWDGVTYHILVVDTETTGGALELVVEAEAVPPPPELGLTIDSIGAFDKDGSVTVTGTFTCAGEADFVGVGGEVRQQVGRFAVTGWFDLHEHGDEGAEAEAALTCDGSTQAWSAVVHGDTGLFKGGSATVNVFGYACGYFECGEIEVSEQIKLRRLR